MNKSPMSPVARLSKTNLILRDAYDAGKADIAAEHGFDMLPESA